MAGVADRGVRAVLLGLALLLQASLGAGLARAADPAFPALSGRVVDAASLLAPEERTGLAAKLKAHEDKTSDQVVVATVPDLQGLTIEDYANRLFRHWALGAKKTNNGVLLLVAPKDRKIRIEVGYGVEGALTDALSKVIISTAITPRFKTGDYAGGLNAGVDAVLSILSGDAETWQRETWHRKAEIRRDEADPGQVIVFIVIFFVILFIAYRMNRGGRGGGRGGGFVVLPGPSSGGWSGGVSGGFGDGGFSGGGGSSGGGGASGDW